MIFSSGLCHSDNGLFLQESDIPKPDEKIKREKILTSYFLDNGITENELSAGQRIHYGQPRKYFCILSDDGYLTFYEAANTSGYLYSKSKPNVKGDCVKKTITPENHIPFYIGQSRVAVSKVLNKPIKGDSISVNFEGRHGKSIYAYENIDILLQNNVVTWVYYELSSELWQ